MIEGTPTQAGTFTITMVANPSGIRGNERKATVTIQVDPLPATIRIPHNHQTIQVGTPMEPSTIELMIMQRFTVVMHYLILLAVVDILIMLVKEVWRNRTLMHS